MVAAILLLHQYATCQQEAESFVAIQSGVSIPFGGYRSAVLFEGSFTQPGFTVSTDGAWFFSRHFGAGISASLNLHPVDVVALGRAQVNYDPFLSDVTIRSEAFRIITVMPGIYAGFRPFEKWSFTGKINAGFLQGKTPYQLYKPDYYLIADNWNEVTSATDSKFSWMAGIRIAYAVSPCIGISLNSDVLYDKLKFNFRTALNTRTDERVIAMVNLLLGIDIKL